jgi:uncharacterized repeat protein (TIGR01451 family)
VQNPTIVLYPDTSINYINTSGSQPSQVTADSIVWSFTNIPPLYQELIHVKFGIDSNLVINSVLSSTATIYSGLPDFFPSDNQDTSLMVVRNSWDPNDIIVDPEIIYTPDLQNDPVLEYTIRFQNTGNDVAYFVRIEQMIPAELDMNTYEFITSSHNVSLLYDGTMKYIFNNINLPDSLSDPEGSQGFVTFRLRPFPGLAAGDSIRSFANIYFDFNPPVTTNTATTYILDPLSVSELNPENSNLVVFPNPAEGMINVKLENVSGQNGMIELINLLGEKVSVHILTDKRNEETTIPLDLSEVPNGIYTLIYSDDHTRHATKFIKMER